MKKISTKFLMIAVLFVAMASCHTVKVGEAAQPTTAICPVCKMSVSTSEGYIYKYNGATYYFDKIDCKNTFKMTPDQFLTRKQESGFRISVRLLSVWVVNLSVLSKA